MAPRDRFERRYVPLDTSRETYGRRLTQGFVDLYEHGDDRGVATEMQERGINPRDLDIEGDDIRLEDLL